MDTLDDLVQRFIEKNAEEHAVINELDQKLEEIIQGQENKVKETALKLMPIMELIAEKGYRFKNPNSSWTSGKGPILKWDGENLLYIFSIEKKHPITVNIDNEEIRAISYRNLLREVEFSQIMDSLLRVLNHHDDLKKEYQESIDAMEAELREYDSI